MLKSLKNRAAWVRLGRGDKRGVTYCHIQRTSMPALFAGTLRLLLTAKRHLLLIYTSFWRFHQVNFQRIKRIKTKPCGSKMSSCGHAF
ncbi:hypothetical protein DET1366 [Dehalococcoides mccartyi 195]|uniref:Uncharacterized protein n=1 Tax=Dehalococcoides mccartyi (strain ATCC BAA-2266 / KCTC 15142 / 195) TaxID=243164 RepID=Q3Z6S2_DEHM1|nr:hypothetical protein DET1366 [Dehalococcoides mccartyi 195]